jgi:hypothetical protein
MPFSRHVEKHLKVIHEFAGGIAAPYTWSSTEVAIQRIKTSVQNLTALANATADLHVARGRIEAALPVRYRSDHEADWEIDRDSLVSAIGAFEAALEAAGPTPVARQIGAWPDASECRA